MRRRELLAWLGASAAAGASTGGNPVRNSDGKRSWTAALEANDTAKALVRKLLLTIDLEDLYGRELCYRVPDPLPAREVSYRGYEVGEIVYWPPRHSFMILYRQNGEMFDMQRIGRLEGGAEDIVSSGGFRATITLVR